MTTSPIDASFITALTTTTADVYATVALIASEVTMAKFAANNQLGVATFTLPASLKYNQAFEFNNI
jgi:hypothetical protein